MTSVKKNKAHRGILVLEQYETRNLKFKKSEINLNNKIIHDSQIYRNQNSNSLFGGQESQ